MSLDNDSVTFALLGHKIWGKEMSLAVVYCRAAIGVQAPLVIIEVHPSNAFLPVASMASPALVAS